MMPIETEIMRELNKAGIKSADQLTPKVLRVINRIFRDKDESNLYPIHGEYNATDRAIVSLRLMRNANGECTVLEYIYGLDAEISRIVNSHQ